MVNRKQKVFICSSVSVWNIDHFQDSVNQILKSETFNLLISLFGTWVGTDWHDFDVWAELGATHLNFKLLKLLLEFCWFSAENVHFIEGNNELVH